ncbi:MAG: class I SAM-dependent methyltransferase [Vicinamibacterales bacterium]
MTTSKVFPRFMTALAHQPAPMLLDLGPVVGPNITFFGERLACKIFVEDLFADVEAHARKGTRDALGADLVNRVAHEPGTIDGILCWDLFDFLDRATGQALASKLTKLLRTGGALYGLFGTTPIDLTHYTRFVVESEDTLRLRTSPATLTRRNVMLTRDINKMFEGLTVTESVLLKTSTRETLFRKS